MYEALALSSIRLSISNPSKSELYITESNTLQALALSSFNSSTLTITQDNLNAAFLFSGLLGLHFFCDTFLTASPDLNTFLDRLVQAIQLLRGIRALVGVSWDAIKNSDIKCLLDADDRPLVDRNDEVTHAFEDLQASVAQSDIISAFESKVYFEAIIGLTKVYNSQPEDGTLDGPGVDSRMMMAWPINISAEYTDLLNQRKPVALIIMAYFSILLYQRRAFWAVGDAGRYLLTAIEEYLGEGWAEWLSMPKEIIRSL